MKRLHPEKTQGPPNLTLTSKTGRENGEVTAQAVAIGLSRQSYTFNSVIGVRTNTQEVNHFV